VNPLMVTIIWSLVCLFVSRHELPVQTAFDDTES